MSWCPTVISHLAHVAEHMFVVTTAHAMVTTHYTIKDN